MSLLLDRQESRVLSSNSKVLKVSVSGGSNKIQISQKIPMT